MKTLVIFKIHRLAKKKSLLYPNECILLLASCRFSGKLLFFVSGKRNVEKEPSTPRIPKIKNGNDFQCRSPLKNLVNPLLA